MDFGYTLEQQQLRKTVRAFCEAEIRPHVMEWDESQTFPDQVFRKLGELGVLGAVFPEELGGSGYSYVDYSLVIEELARVDPSVALCAAAHVSLCTNHIYLAGSEEQTQRSIPKLASGAWIGSSEFADATGLAAAQFYGGYAGHDPRIAGTADNAVATFTLMKVVGRDIWIGVWAFVLSIVATTRWEGTGVNVRPDAGEIWRRFPKFVLGFLVASLIITAFSHQLTFSAFTKTFTSDLVGPIKDLRTWAFTFCFLSIGLTTRFRALAAAGSRPFWAFTSGVVVNVLLGFVLSALVFGSYWTHFGQ